MHLGYAFTRHFSLTSTEFDTIFQSKIVVSYHYFMQERKS
jgi:hypothetical protein